jgi:quinol monooxygenase YgiN
MNNQTLRVVAKAKAQPDKAEALKPILLELVGQTRKDPGCLSYHLLQGLDDPSEFVFVEEWTDDALMQAHLASPHVQHALAQAVPLLAEPPDIRRYAVIA